MNIGNPGEFSILELATMVIGLTGSRSRIVHRPLPQDDPKQRRPDISRAQELLGWQPRTNLKEGLTSTIAYFDRLLSDEKLRAQLISSVGWLTGFLIAATSSLLVWSHVLAAGDRMPCVPSRAYDKVTSRSGARSMSVCAA